MQAPGLYRDAIDLFLGAILMAASLLALVVSKFRQTMEDRGLFCGPSAGRF